MSAPQKPEQQKDKLAIDPLKETELGQIEGGFSEIELDRLDQEAEFNGISCKVTNESQCGKTTN